MAASEAALRDTEDEVDVVVIKVEVGLPTGRSAEPAISAAEPRAERSGWVSEMSRFLRREWLMHLLEEESAGAEVSAGTVEMQLLVREAEAAQGVPAAKAARQKAAATTTLEER